MKNERELLPLLMETSPAAIVTVDLQGRLTYANRRAEEVLGVARREITRRSYNAPEWEVADFDGRPLADDELPFSRVMSTGAEVREQGLSIRLPDGSRRYVTVNAAPLHDAEGRVDGMVAALQDVSELQRTTVELGRLKHEAEKASRAKSEFLATMSHELRTPLASIIGFSQLLQGIGKEPELSEKQRRWVDNIHEAGNHLLELINDVLDLSKIEAGRISFERIPLDFAELGAGVLEVVRPMAQRKEVELRAALPDGLPRPVADPGRLKQVLYNLLSNGIKFTRPGGWVELGARVPEAAARRCLEVWVADCGIGIPPSEQKRIFEEFVQIDSTYSREQQGTGLGLALVQRIVAMHGGDVRVESSGIEGEGATFVCSLPLPGVRAQGSRSRRPAASERRRTSGGGSLPTVLVVEDDAGAADLLGEYLHQGGFEVERATSGEAALQRIASSPPDAVTLDLLLPDSSDWSLLSRIREQPGMKQVPIVVVSVVDDRTSAVAHGADELLVKPIRRRMLLESLRRLGGWGEA